MVSQEDHGMVIVIEKLAWVVTNAIERLDTYNRAEGWHKYEIFGPSHLTPRQTPGVLQVSSSEILIFGGRSPGLETTPLRALYKLNVNRNKIKKINFNSSHKASSSQPKHAVNPRQRQTVLGTDFSVITADEDSTVVYRLPDTRELLSGSGTFNDSGGFTKSKNWLLDCQNV